MAGNDAPLRAPADRGGESPVLTAPLISALSPAERGDGATCLAPSPTPSQGQMTPFPIADERGFRPDWLRVATASLRLAYGDLAPGTPRRQDVHCIVCRGDDGVYRGCEFCPREAWS